MPTELDELRRRIMQLEIEREALKIEATEGRSEHGRASGDRRELERIERELAELQEKNRALTARWEAEKKDLDAVKSCQGADRCSASRSSSSRPSAGATWSGRPASSYGELRELAEAARPSRDQD
jgi:ATP-dependent Clp protease ATP-binding subunit ClpB